ncbi:hypothetical protein IEQ11_02875 [Lysobacter capsici]|jgi:hypothetical protein|uniref:hypothetical protein n=1 Tax=Lysobacter capsici TaxID=435897 RepID=UPI0007166591|nr:hypothetical protein [Lysobacter capsici]ALN83961.1 hypothetical protein LC55x_0661 [Lysobacter capsici]UOF15628.1 hypothetical protein IEQ11_02875 [Lysobacter capsici]WND81355.1 hypothetical protein RJ610_02955 [Lysobacter capsici]WND86551.1 hypothetical protein RJ609_02955 [Lysobacter capsici]
MSKLKNSLLALATAAAVFGASSASAASFELWNGSGWTNTGSLTFFGPTTASYLGIAVPCNASFTVTVSGGAASVTAASFSGSSACTGITAYNLPWAMTPSAYSGANPPFSGSPTLTPTLWSVAISGVRIYIPAPLNVYCPSSTGSGSINGVLDSTSTATQNNQFVFKGALGACSVQTQNNGWLGATTLVRVVP